MRSDHVSLLSPVWHELANAQIRANASNLVVILVQPARAAAISETRHVLRTIAPVVIASTFTLDLEGIGLRAHGLHVDFLIIEEAAVALEVCPCGLLGETCATLGDFERSGFTGALFGAAYVVLNHSM